MERIELIDNEIGHELYDSERSVKVIGRICQNDPEFFRDLWPYALAALVDARIRATEPPKGKPRAKRRP